jgi:hypothetical protein
LKQIATLARGSFAMTAIEERRMGEGEKLKVRRMLIIGRYSEGSAATKDLKMINN